MTTTVTYTNETPPSSATTLGLTLNTAIEPADTTSTFALNDRISYALYEDTATFDAWTSWATTNAVNPTQLTNYSARAI